MRNRKVTALVVALTAAVIFLLLVGNPVTLWREWALKRSLAALQPGEVRLNEVVPFSYDAVYSFDPYTGRYFIESIIGARSSRIRETVSEGMVQLIFVKGKRVVCCVCGYPAQLGYQVHLSAAQGRYKVAFSADDPIFGVTPAAENGVVTLVRYS